ncbi:hypothetical protein M2480_001787 [Parabacteroides sp. PFB2-12]|uniref:AAA family ATPase n=1 Tax=unclassified Parabacteroides TaxID=2649774 RepID=UPI0024737B19|nr:MULTISPECIES: AAA family ATPase [unclassified Parabacteroides]MDH6343161.1 hypothetical protein [Parabacteroides sp. PM6-13]MDH6390805.1 hypothetical protein [Parabacteroides sp. PFB2-12]
MKEVQVYDFRATAKAEGNTEIDLQPCLIDIAEPLPDPEPLIVRNGKTVLSKKDFITISGAEKSRKSFLVHSLCAAFLGADNALGFEGTMMDGTCILFDTEQSKPFVQLAAKRIHRMLEWEYINNKRLIILALRELSTQDRIMAIEQATAMYKPSLIIIDGAVDLLDDFNSISESNTVKQFFLRLTSQYQCGLITVIHENKTNGFMRGNLGSFLAQKGVGVLSVKSEGNHSIVTPRSYRTLPPDEFHFMIDGTGLPELCEVGPLAPSASKYETIFSDMLPESTTLSYSELRDKVMDKLSVKVAAAENRIKKATDMGIIKKNSVGRYYKEYYHEDTTLPF